MASRPTRKRSSCNHENAEHSKHRRPNRFLENVDASGPSRQAVGSAVWRFITPCTCSSDQLRSGLYGASSTDRPVFLYAVRGEWRTKRAQRAEESSK